MTARCRCGHTDEVFPSTIQRALCFSCHEYTCAACVAVQTYVTGQVEPESLVCRRCVGKELRA